MAVTEKDIAANLLMREFFGVDDMYDYDKSSQKSVSAGNCTVSVSDAVPATPNDCEYTPLDFEDTETKLEK